MSQPATDATEDVANSAEAGDYSEPYKWYVLFLLFIVYIFNFIDRQILGILAQPIKEDLGVSDTQLGFMGGIAFAIFHTFVGYGVGYWIPAFFIRSHEFTTTQIGDALFWLGIPGILGTFLGGFIGDRVAKYDVRWYVWLPGIATLLSVPFAYVVYMHGDPWFALWLYAIPVFLGAYYLGPTFSLTQGLVGLRMRALAASILLFVLNIIGLGLGPQFVGIASDVHRADYGSESLRMALVIVLAFNVLSTVLYIMAGRTLKDDLARSHELS